MRELRQNERNFCPHFIPYEKIDHPSLTTRKMVGVGRPLLPEFWAKLTLFLKKR